MTRHATQTRQLLGAFPVQLVIAVVGAFAAAAWTADHPVSTGIGRGLSISWSNVVLAALVGGAGALVFAYAVVFLWSAAAYRLSGYRDQVWEAEVDLEAPEMVFAQLHCRLDPPAPIPHHLEIAVRCPSGRLLALGDQLRLTGRMNPVGVFANLAPHMELDPGPYELRWYALTDQHKHGRSRAFGSSCPLVLRAQTH